MNKFAMALIVVCVFVAGCHAKHADPLPVIEEDRPTLADPRVHDWADAQRFGYGDRK